MSRNEALYYKDELTDNYDFIGAPIDHGLIVVTHDFMTPGGDYHCGDLLQVLCRTDEVPYGYYCSAGNWIVKSKHGISVWSTIHHLLSIGCGFVLTNRS